ncbi:conjugal transfer protein TrbL [Scandinavium goeteborgense]|uniref:TrbL/VirB6 plasmid conjugal transfer protein n=1 Tax=Scandinavium goeteborgense TaxID=1851514 RepID=A0A4R6DSH4_SCAGO|nr:conjugal transfer protein TrbL [Scandinavium goeteborgense]TDN48071.1 hypothetical protein EC847_12822 [Scandinavium goeteborgense]
MSTLKKTAIMLLVLLPLPVLAISNTLSAEIDSNINDYINNVLTSTGSGIHAYVMAFATFIMFICAFGEIVKFINGDADYFAIAVLVIMWFVTMALISSYGMVTDTIKYAFEEISETIQYLSVGSRDKLFLSNFIDRSLLQAVQAPEVGFTDTIYMWVVTGIWGVVSLLLQVAFYLSDVWGTLGTGVAQMIGVLFLPFLIAPQTRQIFDGWVKFYVGWCVCGVVLRITCIFAMLVMKASINAAGSFESPGAPIINGNYDVTAPLVIVADDLSLLISLIVFGIISCLMIFSSYTFAKMLASGVGSSGNAISGVAKKVAAQAIKALL